jgi:hypothetical protein
MYEISGGSFSDLTPPEQAELFGADYFHLAEQKAKGNQWRNSQGEELDIVRYLRGRLIEIGYDMAPAYPANINLMIKNHCKQEQGKDITFIGNRMVDIDELRILARLSIDDVVNRPEEIWDKMPDYYLRFLNSFRNIKDFNKSALLETFRVVGKDVYSKLLKHYWTYQTYENNMNQPTLPPLAGRKDGNLVFFFVTQKASFGSNVSGFMRDYALPLGLKVGLIQLSADV